MKENILVLYASPSKGGNSAQLATWAEEMVNKEKYTVEHVYLYELVLPYFTNENRNAEIEKDPANADMAMLAERIEQAKHVVITFPVWNFGVPAVLKNVLDRCSFKGRVWSEVEKKKVPGWKGKRFYLLFTQGAPWYALALDGLAVLQVWLTLWYFGAKASLLGFATNCGNGSKCVVNERPELQLRTQRRAKKFFG